MVSEEMDLVSSQRIENNLNSQMVFQDENLQFSCGPPQRRPDSGRKTRVLGGFVDEKMFSVEGERFYRTQAGEFRRNIYCAGNDGREGVVGDSDSRRNRPEIRPENEEWNADRNDATTEGSTGTQSEGSDGDEDEEDDDDNEADGEGDGEVEGLVAVDEPQESIAGISVGNNSNKNNNSSSSVQSSSEKNPKANLDRGNATDKANLQKQSSSFGLSRGVLVKDPAALFANSIRGSLNEHQQNRIPHCVPTRFENAITVAEPDSYYTQILQRSGPPLGQKEAGTENGCGFSVRKDFALSLESGDSLRAILSDPIVGALMDDAMILSCGHSFGSGGIQHVMRMQACYTCGQSVSEESVVPNLGLRSAVQAFRREEELQSSRAPKRRRDRFEQEKCSYGDTLPLDFSRGKGVQFPFAVADRVIIQGNKRTPQRFVGREAVVTTQCLNGWYVVKTLDNAESVKLQYRSLSKVSNSQSSNAITNKSITPNWL